MLNSKQRAALRGAANPLDPVFQIGKGEIDETLIQGVADCLAARELIKINVLENSECCSRQNPKRAPTPRCWPSEGPALRRHL